MKNKGNKSGTFILFIIFLIITLIVFLGNLIIAFSHSHVYSDPDISSRNIRGTIYDRHGTVLGIDTIKPCFVVKDTSRINELSAFISPYTDLSALEISQKIKSGNEVFLLSNVSETLLNEINRKIIENGLENILKIESRETRSYPYSSLSLILGSSSTSYSAEGGIEELFNDYLSSYPTFGKETVYGEDIVLTIDVELEEILYESVKTAINTAALLNSRDEIVAYSGPVNESILSAITYSHTTDNETILFLHEKNPFSGEYVDAYPYSIYLSSYDETLINTIKEDLRKNGKII